MSFVLASDRRTTTRDQFDDLFIRLYERCLAKILSMVIIYFCSCCVVVVVVVCGSEDAR